MTSSGKAPITFVIALWVLAACGGERPAAKPQPAPAPAAETELLVFAAASLKEPFNALSAQLEHEHPGVKVSLNCAGSQELRTQIEQGATPDVFASADLKHMNELVKAGHVTTPAVFARNELVIAVAKERIETLKTVTDLAKATRIVVGAPDVPIGRYTGEFLGKAGASLGAAFNKAVQAHIVSRELNVKQVLAKVTLGEADACVVYRSDVKASESVGVVAIPPELNVTATYPIAVLSRAKHPELAQAFIDLVRSEAGQEALKNAGFLAPEQSVATP